MICSKCGNKIKNEHYLILERTNFMHRGNETDEVYLYHKKCVTGKKLSKVWETHEKRVEAEKEAMRKRNSKIHELRKEISEWGLHKNDLF